MLSPTLSHPVMRRQRIHHIVPAIVRRRLTHSSSSDYTPRPVRQHLDQVRRCAKRQYGELYEEFAKGNCVLPPWMSHNRYDYFGGGVEDLEEDLGISDEEDLGVSQTALRGIENVIGIRAEDTEELIRHINVVESFEDCSSDEWGTPQYALRRMFDSWENVRRGSDVFLPGLPKFNISAVYEKAVLERRYAWSRKHLATVEPALLRQACEALMNRRRKKSGTAENDTIAQTVPRVTKPGLLKNACKTLMDNRRKQTETGNNDLLTERTVPLEDDAVLHLLAEATDFDLFEVISEAADIKQHELWRDLYAGTVGYDEPLGREGTSSFWWIMSVEELQVRGHFAKAIENDSEGHIMRRLRWILYESGCNDDEWDCTQDLRKHLVKHHAYWNDPENAVALDEISNVAFSWEFWWDTMEPRELLNALRELRKQQVGHLVIYDYLSALSDRDGLKVLRSNHEIVDAGDRLHNCAATYARRVEKKRCVLVLLEDENGKAVALGERSLAKGSNGWDQISGLDDSPPSDQTRQKFKDYLETFRQWQENHFLPEEE